MKEIEQLQERAAKTQARLLAVAGEAESLEKELGIARLKGAATASINAKLAALAVEQRELLAEQAAIVDAIREGQKANEQAARVAAAAEYARLTGEMAPLSLATWKALDALHIQFCKMAPMYPQMDEARKVAGNLVTLDERIIHPLSIEKSWQAVNAAMLAIVGFQGEAWLKQFGLSMPDLEGEYRGLYPIAPRSVE